MYFCRKHVDMIYSGTDLKFAVNIESPGFSMDDDDFTVDLVNGRRKLTLEKSDMVNGEDGNWYLCFDSSELGTGDIYIIVYAHVPDDDFDDGIRTEVYKDILCHIEGV